MNVVPRNKGNQGTTRGKEKIFDFGGNRTQTFGLDLRVDLE